MHTEELQINFTPMISVDKEPLFIHQVLMEPKIMVGTDIEVKFTSSRELRIMIFINYGENVTEQVMVITN